MSQTILSLTALLINIIAVLAVLLSERKQPSSTLAWLLAVILLPGVGLAAYLLFGNSRIKRVAARSAESAARIRTVLQRHSVLDKLAHPEASQGDARTQALLQLGRRLSSTPASLGNKAKLLVNAAATYRALAHAIDRAEHHIHVQFYIIQPDRFGQALRDRLCTRAAAGIEVRVLCDAVGSAALPDDFWVPLRRAGGQAAAFGPVLKNLNRWRNRDRVDFRNHRKIVVIDGQEGYTGGINVGREYVGLDPETGRWRDTHVEIRGPAVLSLQHTFAEDWYTTTGELLEDPMYFPVPSVERDNPCVIQVVDSGPDRTWSAISYLFTQAFALAVKRIWITSPYFIPNAPVQQVLMIAALRGVDVRLLLPKRADHLLVGLAAKSYYRELLEAGVRIFEYDQGFVHAKTIVVDSWVSTIGSANMDMRSFHLNFELNVLIYGEAIVHQLADQFLTDLDGAHEITREIEQQTGYPKQLLQAAARLMSPLM